MRLYESEKRRHPGGPDRLVVGFVSVDVFVFLRASGKLFEGGTRTTGTANVENRGRYTERSVTIALQATIVSAFMVFYGRVRRRLVTLPIRLKA